MYGEEQVFHKVEQIRDKTWFSALNEDNRKCLIQRSISFIFIEQTDPQQQTYTAVTYEEQSYVLSQLHEYITGSVYETGILSQVRFRFGWMDKNLNSLAFVPALDLIKRYRYGKPTGRDVRMMRQLCKLLSLSMSRVAVEK